MQTPLWLNDVLNLFYPNVCQACGIALNQQEHVICISCQVKLPKTGFHLHDDNPVSRIFWGRVNLYSATSFLFFNKGGNVQKLIHSLKYRNKKDVGELLGALFGYELNKSSLFKNVNVVVPVPLHPKKFNKRGFNQSEMIASGISRAMDIPTDFNNLVRLVNTDSQTRKSRYSRWENVKDVFGINNAKAFEGKHILLVDDVLTTGATMEACAATLLAVKDTKVSIATLAYAQV
jgi:ComF family protein